VMVDHDYFGDMSAARVPEVLAAYA
jgi:NADH:ubiquinone oxidoreductase subunit E